MIDGVLSGPLPGQDQNLTAEQLQDLLFADFEVWARSFAVFKSIKGGTPHHGLLPNILQLRVIAHYRRCMIEKRPCLIMILKPRQKGASTIAEAVCYRHMRTHENLNGALMGDVQSTSDKVFEMFRTYAAEDAYPYADGKPNINLDKTTTDEITLGSGSKWWKETAGSSNAGRSGTVQVLHLDEVAYFPSSDTKDPTTAVLGAFYKEGPMSLGFATSTAKGATGWFHDTWWGDNDWFKVFAAWYEFDDASASFPTPQARQHFERTMTKDELVEQILYNVTVEQLHWRRKKIKTDYKGDTGKFRQEYPSSAQGAFLSSSRMRFEETSVAAMAAWAKTNDNRETGNLRQQIHRGAATWMPDHQGSVHRWEEPEFGRKYLISVDTCTGKDQPIGGTTADPDWHSVQVWRQAYMNEDGAYRKPALAALHHSREDVDILAEIIAATAAYYGNCLVVPEVNNSGLALVKALVKLGVNVFRRQAHVQRRKQETEEEKLEAYGWMTDKLTRKWMIDEVAPIIRQEGVDIKAPEVWAEFQSFIVDDNGSAKAAPSKHDDHVMAACIGIYNLGHATEYKLAKVTGMDLSRLGRDPRYMAGEGWRRRIPMEALRSQRR